MRILQVIEFASPSKGGSVEVARTTAAGLARRGHDVELWSTAHGEVSPIDGVKLRLFRALGLSGLYFTPGILRPALTEVKRFDIVHLHNVRSIQNAAVGTAARRAGVPYVISLHGSFTANGVKVGPKRVFDSVVGTRLIDHASAFLTPSQVEANACSGCGIDPARVHVAHNPVAVPEVPPMAHEERPLPIIGYLGRLDRSKGVDRLLAAFADARSRRPDLRLEIAGPDDGDGDRLRRCVLQAALQDVVRFRGPLYGHDKWRFLARCAVLASPCRFEVFGLATFEALAMGTPVVAAMGSGGATMVVQSGAGLLVNPDDAQAFGQALLSQLDNTLTARKQGARFVRAQLSVDAYIDRVEALYLETINEVFRSVAGRRAAAAEYSSTSKVGAP